MKILDDFKKKLKFIERSINSSRTPEEFLMRGGAYPEIERVQQFLAKYPISQIIKAQMYNRKEDLYYHDGYFGFVLTLRIEPKIEAQLQHLLKFGFPESSYLNFILDNVGQDGTTLMSLVTKEHKNKTKNKNNQHILISIRKKIIELFKQHDLAADVVRPDNLLHYYNQRLNGKTEEHYDPQQYIFAQIKPWITPEIDSNGVLTIGGDKCIVFYTRQYPNVRVDPFIAGIFQNPIASIMQDFIDVGIEMYYSLSVDLANKLKPTKNKSQENLSEKQYVFNTTIIVKFNEFNSQNQSLAEFTQEIIEYFRYKHDWYIFPNYSSSFQKFMSSLPLQYDQDVTALSNESSINQIYPLSKIAELLPIGVRHE